MLLAPSLRRLITFTALLPGIVLLVPLAMSHADDADASFMQVTGPTVVAETQTGNTFSNAPTPTPVESSFGFIAGPTFPAYIQPSPPPTPKPTPTTAPVIIPSPEPTPVPTVVAPTQEPTPEPSPAPTEEATVAPGTPIPTEEPTPTPVPQPSVSLAFEPAPLGAPSQTCIAIGMATNFEPDTIYFATLETRPDSSSAGTTYATDIPFNTEDNGDADVLYLLVLAIDSPQYRLVTTLATSDWVTAAC